MRRVGVPAAEAALHVQQPGQAVRRCRNFSRRLRDAKPRVEQPMAQEFLLSGRQPRESSRPVNPRTHWSN